MTCSNKKQEDNRACTKGGKAAVLKTLVAGLVAALTVTHGAEAQTAGTVAKKIFGGNMPLLNNLGAPYNPGGHWRGVDTAPQNILLWTAPGRIVTFSGLTGSVSWGGGTYACGKLNGVDNQVPKLLPMIQFADDNLKVVYAGFPTLNNGNGIRLAEVLDRPIVVPPGATRIIGSWPDSRYGDNSGNCAFTLTEALPQCSDGKDNDGDGATDLADFSCQGNALKNDESTPLAQCQDGRDNDGDGTTDLADVSCQNNRQKDDELNPRQCQDGVDNDRDGAVDLKDYSCQNDPLKNDEALPKAPCSDGLDNDGDGAKDLDDFSCNKDPQGPDETNPKSQCQDGKDNDGDGAIDLNDYSCLNNPQKDDEATPKSQCQDGQDNDGDGAIDLIDYSCLKNNQRNDEANPKSQCQDGQDNDGDGAIDGADFSCFKDKQNNDESTPKSQCQDGKDNDADGAIDLADYSCLKNNQRDDEFTPKSQCQDGQDNDGDGAIDGADFSCFKDKQNNDESNPKSQCQDGIDNDGDGFIDSKDPGCAGQQDNDEKNAFQCSDGQDNDGDGAIDLNDYSCLNNPTKNDEATPLSECQDGRDNDGDGAIDLADFSCQNDKQKNSESTPKPECSDDKDNDGDGAIDLADYSCLNDKQKNDESTPKSLCQDGQDNDGDGAIDLADYSCQNNKQNNDETNPKAACQDGKDNDGDGLIDLVDPGCTDKQDNDESNMTQCKDGKDNDGDGLIDLADPGCTDPNDDSEAGETSKLQLTSECVYDNGNSTYTAYFGYENLSGQDLSVAVGGTGTATENSFSPGAANRGQVSLFKKGRVKGAFGVTFDGNTLTWTVRVPSVGLSTATVSKNSPACKLVEPIAQCIVPTAGGFKATLGYANPNEFQVSVPVGTLNGFTPAPLDRGQPSVFFAGSNLGVFSVPFTGELVWSLPGKSAKASSALPTCPGACSETPTASIKGSLDQVALQLAEATKKAADFLAKNAKVKLARSAAAAIGRDAQNAKRRADEFVKKANEYTVQFPAVVKNCPDTPKFCETVDRYLVIEALKGLYANQRNACKRIVARGYFNSTGRTKRLDALVEQAKALEQQGLAALSQIPRFATECK